MSQACDRDQARAGNSETRVPAPFCFTSVYRDAPLCLHFLNPKVADQIPREFTATVQARRGGGGCLQERTASGPWAPLTRSGHHQPLPAPTPSHPHPQPIRPAPGQVHSEARSPSCRVGEPRPRPGPLCCIKSSAHQRHGQGGREENVSRAQGQNRAFRGVAPTLGTERPANSSLREPQLPEERLSPEAQLTPPA